ncbi:MAG: hypothetical protein ACI8UO_002668 [Verrucomicrobiales bacterium]|jgi:hypothetical protein
MYHLATFHHEDSAEKVAGCMEMRQIRTGLRGDHTASGQTIFNLFVSDLQAEDAIKLFQGIVAGTKEDEDVLSCPICNSHDVHPASDAHDLFPIEPRFRLTQISGAVVEMTCKKCGHSWI